MLKQPNNRRSGIALVMVLGVLSLMVLMAVSFAISMRTERVAAGNQLDTVRARQLAQVGLVRAMDLLYEECGSSLTNSNQIYPDWDVMVSYTSPPVSAVAVDFLKGSASNFVPRALWDAAISEINHSDNSNGTYWIYINSETAGTTNLIGRVAFMILNCSGLLDANFVGGADRGIGTNPVEIALQSLPEVDSTFANGRNEDVRYETQEELNALADIKSAANNLFIYSRAPAGYYTNNVTTLVGTQVNLAGNLNDIQGRSEQIIGAFEKAGFSSGEAGLLFTNLLLYLDPGAATIGPQSPFQSVDPSGELALGNAFVAPVPMVNELMFRATIKCTKVEEPSEGVKIYTYKFDEAALWVELWNPFIASILSAPLDLAIRLSGGSYGYIPEVPSGSGDGFPVGEPVGTGQFVVVEYNWGSVCEEFQAVPPGPHIFGVSNLSVEVRSGGHKVDKVFPYRDLNLAIDLPNKEGERESAAAVLECIDPRFNWDPNDEAGQWGLSDTNTLGGINKITSNFWNSASLDCDKSWEMYVASSNSLKSVGELGYLVYKPWRTLKLYGPGAHPALDYFAIETNCGDFVTNVIWCGRVNPNTTNRTVLAAVFDNMPVDEYPGQTNPPRLDWSQAGAVADFIIQNGPYTNLSDICRLDWENEGFPNPSFAENELRREAFLRNTAGLLSTRDQVYTVLIEAHLASGGNIPRNPSRQRAVAVVWRDAWTGEMILRYLKWLPD